MVQIIQLLPSAGETKRREEYEMLSFQIKASKNWIYIFIIKSFKAISIIICYLIHKFNTQDAFITTSSQKPSFDNSGALKLTCSLPKAMH